MPLARKLQAYEKRATVLEEENQVPNPSSERALPEPEDHQD